MRAGSRYSSQAPTGAGQPKSCSSRCCSSSSESAPAKRCPGTRRERAEAAPAEAARKTAGDSRRAMRSSISRFSASQISTRCSSSLKRSTTTSAPRSGARAPHPAARGDPQKAGSLRPCRADRKRTARRTERPKGHILRQGPSCSRTAVRARRFRVSALSPADDRVSRRFLEKQAERDEHPGHRLQGREQRLPVPGQESQQSFGVRGQPVSGIAAWSLRMAAASPSHSGSGISRRSLIQSSSSSGERRGIAGRSALELLVKHAGSPLRGSSAAGGTKTASP